MIEQSADITKLICALHKAQGKLTGVPRDSVNPHFKNRYASLENVIDVARGPLQDHGLAFTQAPGALINGAVEVTTMLMHESGQWLRSTLHVPLSKNDPQGVGSAITYGCRYALMATLGLPPTDDDAEGAIQRAPTKSVQVAGPNPGQPAPIDPAKQSYLDDCATIINDEKSPDRLKKWLATQAGNVEKYGLTQAERDALKDRVRVRLVRIAEQLQPAG